MSPPELLASQRDARSAARGAGEVWIVEPRGAGPLVRARELWRYRRLLPYFALTTIQFTYKATVLTWFWLVVRPLAPMVAFLLVLEAVAGVQSGDIPFFLFFLVGTSVWHLFEESLIWVTRSFQIHRRILARLYFPRMMVPLSSAAPGLVEFSIYLLLIGGTLVYFLVAEGRWYLVLGPHSPLALAAVVLALAMAFGLGFFTSVLGAEHRDVRFTLRYVLRFWYFLTPIMYPSSLIPEQWRWAMALNPMTTVVELFRWGVLGRPSALSADEIGLATGIILLIFAAGLLFFARAEAAAVDRL